MKHKSMKHKSRRKSYKKTKKQTKRLSRKRARRTINQRRSRHRHRMRGGEVTYVSPPGPTPSTNSSSQITANNSQQNTMNHNGGKRKQKGGMGSATQCSASSFLNSLDNFGYIAPDKCIQVPVVRHGQELATASVHISATGQANAEFDNKISQ